MTMPWPAIPPAGVALAAGCGAVAGRSRGAYPGGGVRLADLCARDKPARQAMSVSHPEDLALVRSALAGERAAKERLAQRLGCVGRMVAARNRSFGAALDEHALGDLVGDIVVRVLQKLGAYSGYAAFESWVYVFCEGELRNAVRRRRRLAAREAATADGAEDAVPANAPAALDEDVHLCLEKLPEEDRRVMRWKHFEDATLEEIAARLVKNLNTVKSRYTRALRQLKLCLQRRGKEGEQ